MFYFKIFQDHIIKVSIGIGTVVVASIVTFNIYRKPKKITRIIDTMEFLNKSTVHIKNRDKVEEIVSQLIKGGASKLRVISDFDFTLSRSHKNGKRCSSSYGALENPSYVSEDYVHKINSMNSHYHPIEVDPNLTMAEKTPLMIEWYTKANELMPTSGITKSTIPKMVAESNICLREGCDILSETLYKHSVPLLVFSAGIGDVIKEVMQSSNILYPNVEIIANLLRFNEQGVISGFKEDIIIHTFNKNQSSIGNKDYFEQLKSRSNIILLGDTLGDLAMSEGINDVNAILKIGFLNFKAEENLTSYLNAYDIVLTDDQTLDVAVGLLQSIL